MRREPIVKGLPATRQKRIEFTGPIDQCIQDRLIIESNDANEPIMMIDLERGPCAPITDRRLRGE